MKSPNSSGRLPPVSLPALLALLVLALLAGACATPSAAPLDGNASETGSDASDDGPGPESEAAPASDQEEFLKPDAHSAVIVFWRPDDIGIHKTVQLYTDLNLARFINQHSIQQIKVPAGPLVLMARARTWEFIRGEVMPGMTYHVLVNVTQKAKRVFARLELVQPDDPRLAGLAETLPSTDRYPEKTYARYQR